jgi:hypothetical protein
MRLFNDAVKYTPFYSLDFAKNDIIKFSKYLDLSVSENEFDNLDKSKYRISEHTNIHEIINTISAKDYQNPYNIHSPIGFIDVFCIRRYIQYLQDFIDSDGKIEKNINENLNNNEFSCKKLFPELLELSDNIIIEYVYGKTCNNEQPFYTIDIDNVSRFSINSELEKYVLSLFRIGFTRLVSKLTDISYKDRINILYDLIYDFKELLFLVDETERIDQESKNGLKEKSQYKVFAKAKFKGNKDHIIANSEGVRNSTLQEAQRFAASWLDAINIMIQKLEYTLNNSELIEFSKKQKPKTPITISDVDNQTRALYIHFRVQMGDIPVDKMENDYKVIMHNKYVDNADKNSYQEYRKIINGKVKPDRLYKCCNILINLVGINPAIINQAKALLPR